VILEFTENEDNLKDNIDNQVKISLLCTNMEETNTEVLKLIENDKKSEAMSLLESSILELEKYVDLDESKLTFHVLNRAKKTLEDLKKKTEKKINYEMG